MPCGKRRAYFVHDPDVNELEIDVEHLIAAVGVYVNFNHGLHAATSRNINVHELRLTARWQPRDHKRSGGCQRSRKLMRLHNSLWPSHR